MITISKGEARTLLLATVGPDACTATDPTGLLRQLAHIQLDPIDRIGTNADLVAMARIDVPKGGIHAAKGFEHYAKEKCMLPPEAWPYYREQALRTPHWRHNARMKELPDALLDAVEAEVRQRGPLTAGELSDHGAVVPTDWSGWKGTGKAGTLALTALTLRCRLVIVGRRNGQRLVDTPERALPEHHDRKPKAPFVEWALLERVRACGLLSTAAGPWWGGIRSAMRDGTVERLVEDKQLAQVRVDGERRVYLTRPAFLERKVSHGTLRILGPLDPFIWNRPLIRHAFDFEYVWEVYKPASKRRWGYYVTPLLHEGELVGRIEATVDEGRLQSHRVWEEPVGVDRDALKTALARHGRLLGVDPA